MKQIEAIIITLLIGISINTFGQKFRTMEQYQNHYIENYKTIDKIEGIWYVLWNQQINNDFQHLQPYTVAIIKEGIYYKEYMLKDGYYSPISYERGFVHPTSGYKYYEKTSKIGYGETFYLYTNSKKFSFVTNQLQSMKNTMREAGRNPYYLKKALFSYSYSKLYPLEVDIQIAKKQKSNIALTGTGFAISTNGYIVTNYHVVKDASKLNIKGINGNFQKSYSAKIVISDRNNDLAILKINDYSFSNLGIIPYALKSKSISVGTDIFVLGYPLTATMGEEIKLTNGIISAKSGFKGDITSYQMSAAIQSGNSGAPMFDNNGYLTGIVNAKHTGAENAGYAIKTTYLLNLIDAAPVNIKLPAINKLSGKSLPTQVSLIKDYIYIIEVN